MLTNGLCKSCILEKNSPSKIAPNISSSQSPIDNATTLLKPATKNYSHLAPSTVSPNQPNSLFPLYPHFPMIPPHSGSNLLPTMNSFPSFADSSSNNGHVLSNGGNPLLEQLFEWNYRFAKESAAAGNINLIQQKLFQSHMLAAHLMNATAQPSANFPSAMDALRLMRKPADFAPLDVVNMNKFSSHQ